MIHVARTLSRVASTLRSTPAKVTASISGRISSISDQISHPVWVCFGQVLQGGQSLPPAKSYLQITVHFLQSPRRQGDKQVLEQ